MDLKKQLNKAKIALLVKNAVFLSTLVFSLKHRFSTEIPTAATDGKEIIFNPDWYSELSEKEQVFLLAHEALHVAYNHLFRRGTRETKRWNAAGDYVINLHLVDSGYTMPKQGLFDTKFRGMSTDEVYVALEGEDFSDFDEDIIEINGEEKKDLESKVKEILVRAANTALVKNDRGSIPSEIFREIENLINPKLDWRSLLERFVSEKTKEDYSWKKPNRRFTDIYLPSLYSDTIPLITVAMDTSGSISNEAITEMLSEVVYLYETFKPEKMVIIDCDCFIHGIHEVSSREDILAIKLKGGGGSSSIPIFNYCEENSATLLVYFTDMYLEFPKSSDIPTLWVSYGSDQYPFGELIKYE